MSQPEYDVVIVGTGIAGAILAKELGTAGARVLLLEAGIAIPPGREAFFERYLLDTAKFPEAPFGNNMGAQRATIADLVGPPGAWKEAHRTYLDQSESTTAFGSTYERLAGGTMWHWMGTSLRLMPHDFRMRKEYGRGVDWPIEYDDLAITSRRPDGKSYYDLAEYEIGVSASVAEQRPKDPGAAYFRAGYHYPNPAIPLSVVDKFFRDGVGNMQFQGSPVGVVPTPAGRNSRPYDNRRACAGNTNCVPICPIEAKYDPTVTLHKAFNTGNVFAHFQCVATKLERDGSGRISGVRYVRYEDPKKPSSSKEHLVRARRYVVAANGIETPKLLLLSGLGEVNPNIGRNLMDHPFYLRWGLAKQPVYPYRGPLSTGGLDTLRDGSFRSGRAAFRIEIGNDGWALAIGDPYITLLDQIDGSNRSGTNGEAPVRRMGSDLVNKLNDVYTRQCRIGFELEQLPDPENRVTLSHHQDALGIKRPKIAYSLSEYEKRGLEAAREFTGRLFPQLGIEDHSADPPAVAAAPFSCEWNGQIYGLMGAGHIMGTYRMGDHPGNSVVNPEQRSWNCDNLFLLGSGVFPTGGTANPTLTIAALSFWAADTIKKDLGRSSA